MTKTHSLSRLGEQSEPQMQLQTTQDKIEKFLDRKFRASRSFATRQSYQSSLKKFFDFLRVEYNLDLEQLLRKIQQKQLDPIEVLDDYYTYLSKLTVPKTGKTYSTSAIRHCIITAKEFLNGERCHIYMEDLKQKFKLPRNRVVWEEGLTKEIINRVIRLGGPKLATVILIACSSGLRISEIVQLRLSDIDFDSTPTMIIVRAETTKTRQPRITCFTAEATKSLRDYIAKTFGSATSDRYIFLQTHEDRIAHAKARLVQDNYKRSSFRIYDQKRVAKLESQMKNLSAEELHAKSFFTTKISLERMLRKVCENIPELNKRNPNGRLNIHFHAFRAWFKTQVTDAHQSDFAEALMGHSSLKLVYYRQNKKARAKTYLGIEHAITIADTEQIDENYAELQEDNKDLRAQLSSLQKTVSGLVSQIKEY